MRLAVDATALLLPRTGIGVFTAEVLRALAARPDIRVLAFNTGPGAPASFGWAGSTT